MAVTGAMTTIAGADAPTASACRGRARLRCEINAWHGVEQLREPTDTSAGLPAPISPPLRNCGAEGPTADEGINAQRNRMMRSFHLILMLSQGTPMMLMGDEYGHTKNGNNNTYGHDNSLSWFQWNALEKEREGFFRFCAKAIHFRKQHPLLGREDFLSDSDVTWHESNWDDAESRFLMVQMHQRHGNGGAGGAGSLLAAFNAHAFHIDPLGVPPAPAGCVWSRVVRRRAPRASNVCLKRQSAPVPKGAQGTA